MKTHAPKAPRACRFDPEFLRRSPAGRAFLAPQGPAPTPLTKSAARRVARRARQAA